MNTRSLGGSTRSRANTAFSSASGPDHTGSRRCKRAVFFMRRGEPVRQHRDADAVQRRVTQCARLVHHQHRHDRQLFLLRAVAQGPGIATALAVLIQRQRTMVARSAGTSGSPKRARYSGLAYTCVGETTRACARREWNRPASHPQRQVEIAGDEIDDLVAQMHVEAHVRITGHELRHQRHDDLCAEGVGRRYPQPSARRAR